jgi:hypothetical protein
MPVQSYHRQRPEVRPQNRADHARAPDLRVHAAWRNHAGIFGRYGGVNAAGRNVFPILVQDLPPTQVTLAAGKKTGGAFGYLKWGISHGTRTSVEKQAATPR